MKPPESHPSNINPAEIAREAFRQLAIRRIAPTPDAYRDIYHEITGTSVIGGAETALNAFIDCLIAGPEGMNQQGRNLAEAVASNNWSECEKQLIALTDQLFITPPANVKQAALPNISSSNAFLNPSDSERLLREMLVRTLTFTIASLLQDAPDLADEASSIGLNLAEISEGNSLNETASRLKQLAFKIDIRSGDSEHQRTLTASLLQLLLENIKELVEDDSWLLGQITNVQDLLTGPLDAYALKEAIRNLKDVIFKQGILKHSLTEAKATVKTMMLTFIDRLGNFAVSTDDYHHKMSGYATKIRQADDITSLNHILDDVMQDTRIAQTEALRSRDAVIAARQEAQAADAQIRSLQQQLTRMSELVLEDQLTGSLNRRGMEDVLVREMARADRQGKPFCIAMLDLDDFKSLNDRYGHLAGDQALVHLVQVIKDTLRTMDVISRFGGEEFLIVLPDTPLDSAMATITRVQRELTKRIFMHKNERILVTFSAGVALRAKGEEQPSIVRRADEALYKAKKAGKNRVIAST